MAWTTGVSGVTITAATATTGQIDGRSGAREGASLASDNTYSIVGMNMRKVDAVVKSIDMYCERIKLKLEAVDANAKADDAFKGDLVQQAVKNYIEKVKLYSTNLTSQLKAFQDEILDAKAQWQASLSSFASNIDTNTSQFNAGEEYRNVRSAEVSAAGAPVSGGHAAAGVMSGPN